MHARQRRPGGGSEGSEDAGMLTYAPRPWWMQMQDCEMNEFEREARR